MPSPSAESNEAQLLYSGGTGKVFEGGRANNFGNPEKKAAAVICRSDSDEGVAEKH